MDEFLMQKLLPYFQINFCLLPVQYKILLGLISFIKNTFYCLNIFIVVLLPHSYNRGFTQRQAIKPLYYKYDKFLHLLLLVTAV